MVVIETSETKLTPAEKKVLESVINHCRDSWEPAHVQSRQLRTAKNLVKKGYLKPDNKFCYSGGFYQENVSYTILNNYIYAKHIHVSPKKEN